ncbi:MAG: FkbM family methyltransferase [Elusimicrobiota bacterium]|jgi:FkbM family methyltransferase
MLMRRLVWHNPCTLSRLSWWLRFFRLAYRPVRWRYQIMQKPLRRAFLALDSLGLTGQGGFRLNVKGQIRELPFNGRNLQFTSLYMPQHSKGYEPEVTTLMDLLAQDRAVVYDIGSNWGYFSLVLAARPNFSGRVHAFEPIPDSFADLRGLVEACGLADQIDCHAFGLSDRSAQGTMTAADSCAGTSGRHSGFYTLRGPGGSGVPVELRRLDDLGLEPPDVIKIDVESHEGQVISGGAQTIARSRPMIILENILYPKAPELTLKPLQLLAELGYEFWQPAWAPPAPDRLYALPDTELEENAELRLALIPVSVEQRFILRDAINLLACHKSRTARLHELFNAAA